MILLLIGGSIAEMIGRKPTLIIGQSGIVIGWIIMYFARNFAILLLGRIITGAGVGLCFPISTLLLSEVSLIRMRGMLSMMGNLVTYIGVIYSLIIADNFSLHTLMVLSLIPLITFLVFSWFLPESPVWLMKKGYMEKARISLISVRGSNYDTCLELEEIKSLVESQEKSSLSQKLRYLKSRENIIPLLILSLIFLLQVRILIFFNLKYFCILAKINNNFFSFTAFLWSRNYWLVFS